MLSSPNKIFVLSQIFLNFLRIFCKLKGEFLRALENFAPLPGIQPSFFARGRELAQKNLPGWPGFARSKKISPGLPGGDIPSWNLLRHKFPNIVGKHPGLVSNKKCTTAFTKMNF